MAVKLHLSARGRGSGSRAAAAGGGGGATGAGSCLLPLSCGQHCRLSCLVTAGLGSVPVLASRNSWPGERHAGCGGGRAGEPRVTSTCDQVTLNTPVQGLLRPCKAPASRAPTSPGSTGKRATRLLGGVVGTGSVCVQQGRAATWLHPFLRQVSAAGGGGRAGAGGPGRLMRAPPLLPPDNIVAHVSKVHNLRRAGAQRLALSNRPHARA